MENNKKNLKQIIYTIIITIMLISLVYVATRDNSYVGELPTEDIIKSEELQIYFFNVGQADCILVRSNGKNMLIDAGDNEDGPLLVEYIRKLGINRIDYLIGTHVHGLSGNFYENRFLDNLAERYTNKGYSFLTFNNRGKDYITEMLKGNECVILGSCYELFKDCILDIDGVINWVKSHNYTEITLEGHSYGCNKVIYYYDNKKQDCIKNIVLLAPCDIPTEIENYTGDMYKECIDESKKLIEKNKENELIDFPVFANEKISAKTFFTDFLYESDCDFFRYREKSTKSEILNKINIPVLIIFGDKDECVLTEPKEIVINYLKNNIKNCKINVIEDTNHSYDNKYEELGKIVEENL